MLFNKNNKGKLSKMADLIHTDWKLGNKFNLEY